MKMEARHRGEDIVDFGMGNPDLPTPPHVVAKLIEAASKPQTTAIRFRAASINCAWRSPPGTSGAISVDIDPDSEAIVTIGAKEGLSHLAWATIDPGDVVLCPSPTYPIHQYRRGLGRRRSALHSADDQRSVFRPSRRGDPADLAQAEDADHQLSAQSDDAKWSSWISSRRVVQSGQGAWFYRRPRSGLCRSDFRRLPGAEFSAGAGRQRCRRGIFLAVEELQHARLACRLLRRQQGNHSRAWRASRVISTTVFFSRSRSRRFKRSTGRRIASKRSASCTRSGATP